MTTIIKYIITLCSLGALTGCSDDFFNLAPKDEVSDAKFWQDNQLVKTYVNGLYTVFNFVDNWGDGANELGLDANMAIDCWSDDAYSGAFDYIHTVSRGLFTSTHSVDGGYSYGRIRQTNIAIQNIAAFSTNLSEKDKAIYIAEARMIRAMLYFQKVKYFGGIPIISKIMTLEDELLLSRNTEEQCIDFILEDLEYAQKHLPKSWKGADWGRMTQGAALAIKAKVELHAGRYDACIATSFRLVDSDEFSYDLEPQYADLFNNPNTFKSSKEVLFAWQFKYPGNGHILELKLCPNVATSDIKGWGMPCPTQSLVDDYYILDSDGKARKWSESVDFLRNYATQGVAAMWNNRDQRFYATIIYNGCAVEYKGAQGVSTTTANLYCNPKAEERLSSWMSEYGEPARHESRTGYAPRKFKYQSATTPLPNWTGKYDQENHYVYIRYGEVLLNYAEALLMKNESDAKAMGLVNELRHRAGLPDYTALTFEDYKRERRVELAFEGQRYFDMIRWAKCGKHDPEIPEFNQISKMIRINGSEAKTYEITDIKFEQDNARRLFETPKRYYFPIPFSETVKNPNLLPNNPGWE